MTFTVVARCDRTGQTGIGLTTVSIAAGGLCPFYTRGGDIVVSQAYAAPRVGLRVVSGMEAGETPQVAIAAAQAMDGDPSFRQIMVLGRTGATVAYTGADCRPWAGHIAEADVAVAGNVLAGPQVIDAMLMAFRNSAGRPLADRLIQCLEAGRDAGGQATPDGLMLSERSAMVRVMGAGAESGLALVDLRVDLHGAAVNELRRVYEIHAVYAGYSEKRDLDPRHCGSIISFEAEKLRQGGAFAERPSVYR